MGYRYFETIPGSAQKVNYPFGFGLSYTKFQLGMPVVEKRAHHFRVMIDVCNIGKYSGKEVVQVYYSAPQGKLGKPARELVAFQKTRLLAPGETQTVVMRFQIKDMASYDDLGKVQKSAYVLEVSLLCGHLCPGYCGGQFCHGTGGGRCYRAAFF